MMFYNFSFILLGLYFSLLVDEVIGWLVFLVIVVYCVKFVLMKFILLFGGGVMGFLLYFIKLLMCMLWSISFFCYKFLVVVVFFWLG